MNKSEVIRKIHFCVNNAKENSAISRIILILYFILSERSNEAKFKLSLIDIISVAVIIVHSVCLFVESNAVVRSKEGKA